MVSSNTSRRALVVLAVLSYLLAAFLFTKVHLQSTRESPQATLEALASGTAQPFFRPRLLVPLLALELL